MMQKFKVLITGSDGQLGRELLDSKPEGADVVAVNRAGLDITDRKAVIEFVDRMRPDLVINAAAYTAVDKAETEAKLAFAVNRDGAAHLAEAAKLSGTRLIHISTDFVFDGKKSSPYLPEDTPNPLGIYGESKLAGEQVVAKILEGNALIVRTAWVYSKYGNNFVKTMLKLFAEREEVRVIADQVGTPTHAGGLAKALWRFSDLSQMRGIYHWTDAGVASWYDFAQAILEFARLQKQEIRTTRLVPITTADYPLPAQRPAYSVLNKTGAWAAVGLGIHWQQRLRALAD